MVKAPGNTGWAARSGAEGRVPLPGAAESVQVKWTRTAKGARYRLTTPVPIVLHLDQAVEVSGEFDREISL